MPKSPALLPVPRSLADLLRRPQTIQDAYALLNRLAAWQSQLSPAANNPQGIYSALHSRENFLVPLPLQFPTRIEDAAASDLSTASQLNLLLTHLRTAKINPVPQVLDLATLEAASWRDRVLANGGTLAADSFAIANAVLQAIAATTFNSKLVYLLPLLGTNLIAARVPLRDSFSAGLATNTGFVDADFSQATGLQGDGLTKMLGTGITSAQAPGMGYWENNYAATPGNPPAPTSTVPIGNASTGGARIFWVRNWSDSQIFHSGSTGGDADPAAAKLIGAGGNHHYYGQPEGNSLRRLVKDGVSVATSSVTTAQTGAGDHEINVLGVNYAGTNYFYPGRCACAYLTSSPLTAGEYATLHSILQTYLITPTGR